MDMEMDREELNLNLSLHPSSPSFPTMFSCCYCPKKFRSSQALGGHQNAHKLQRNLVKRNREAALAIAQGKGGNAVVEEGSSARSAESDVVVLSGKKRHDELWLVEQGSGGAASSGMRTHKAIEEGIGNEELATIDLSLKL